MNKKIIYLVGILIMLLWSGCGTIIRDLDSYQDAGALRSPDAPSVDRVATKQIKIVIYGIENQDGGKQSHLSRLAANNIQRLLSQTNVKIVDRSALETFSEEAILAQTKKGNEGSAAAAAADYAIKGNISGNTSASYRKGYYYPVEVCKYNAVLERRICRTVQKWKPPQCTYYGRVSGDFTVYKLPSLQRIEAVSLQNSKSITKQQNAPCNNNTIAQRALDSALNRSISKSSAKKIKNLFAAKGYVSDLRRKKNNYIVKITLGSDNGVKQEAKIGIYRSKVIIDKLSQKEKKQYQPIAKAIISNLVGSDSAWCVIKDKKEAEKILIGDVVKVHY